MSVSLSVSLLDELFSVPHCGVGLLQLGSVVPVQVLSGQRAAVVTYDDSIRVEHRNHLEHKHISEKLIGDHSR